jgi:hypothetical protein
MVEPQNLAVPELGNGLPSATRFCLVPDDTRKAVTRPRLVAFLPCQHIEKDGLHLVFLAQTLQTRECRSVANGVRIEGVNGGGLYSVEQFSRIVLGRVIGIALLDVAPALLSAHFNRPITIGPRLRPAPVVGPSVEIRPPDAPADPREIERAASEWAKLEEAVSRLGFKPTPMDSVYHHWMQLRPFVAWCISRGRRPSEVRSDDVTAYIDARRLKRAYKASKFNRAQRLRQAWNHAVQHFPGWPVHQLPFARFRRHNSCPVYKAGRVITFERARFHPSLVAEVNTYCESGGFLPDDACDQTLDTSYHDRMLSKLARLSSAEMGDFLASSNHRQRRLCAKTLREHSQLIYRAATALHVAGVSDIGDLQHIVDVATPRAAALLADRITAQWKEGNRPSSYAALTVYTLCAIARRCGVHYSVGQLMAVRDLVHELLRNIETTRHMSTTNLDRVMQFDDPRLFSMLVALPDVLMQELEDERKKKPVVR